MIAFWLDWLTVTELVPAPWMVALPPTTVPPLGPAMAKPAPADLQSATQDAEAAAEKLERQRRGLEADLQDVQEKLDDEQKVRVKFQKQFAKADEELRQAKLKIDDLTNSTSDQYVALKRLQEDNSNQRAELEALDEKQVQWNRLRKQTEVQLSELKAQL